MKHLKNVVRRGRGTASQIPSVLWKCSFMMSSKLVKAEIRAGEGLTVEGGGGEKACDVSNAQKHFCLCVQRGGKHFRRLA